MCISSSGCFVRLGDAEEESGDLSPTNVGELDLMSAATA
jgi:hypothetical protein